MSRRAVDRVMRRLRGGRRGLAEIVGTLMLVVIVVAAATAFSFFVAAYQKQLQAEETMNHDRQLENVKVIGVSEVQCENYSPGCAASGAQPNSFASLTFVISSLDVNNIGVTGLFLNDHGVVNYTVTLASGASFTPCFNGSKNTSGTPLYGLIPCAPVFIPSYSAVKLVFDLDENLPYAPAFGAGYDTLLTTSDLTLQVLTALTNVFTETFSAPDAVASVFFVSSGGSTVPVFDGLNSYQPAGANNASILWYNWTVTGANVPTSCAEYSGPEFECDGLTSNDSYNITLEVTDTNGLTGSTSLSYTQP